MYTEWGRSDYLDGSYTHNCVRGGMWGKNQDRPTLGFKDVAKRIMKWRKIAVERWQSTANNSVVWRSATKPKP